MLNLTNITVDFGTSILFENITLTVKPKDKIGLAGRNGAGKSTLLKIISGKQEPSSGSISYPTDYSIGYLPQELKITSTESIFEETKSALSKLTALEEKQQEVTHQITTRTDYESDEYMDLIELLNKLNDQLHFYEGSSADKRIEEVLKGLGFSQEDMDKPINTFSGGWQMRVELAKLLLQNPDLILLDEPTNHLDIESILWLEQFLINYNGALIMVSHDKQFLDAITTRTVEIIHKGIEDYKANYSTFLHLREERVEKLAQAQKNQEREIAQIERNIEKFRAKANKAKFAQSLIKKLDKMDRIDVENYDLKDMNLRFTASRRSGKEVVVAKQASKAYENKKIIDSMDFTLLRGEKIAFVGKNGMGKSTFAKMIVNEIDFDGSITIGHNVDIGYYAQHQNQQLDSNKTLLETIEYVAPKHIQGKERSVLGSFLFSGEDVDKKVSVLSGGEKARLAMAKMILKPINFLVLDEPTNHLDISSKEVLKHALNEYEGTLLIISHDRDFLTGLTSKVYEFTPHGIVEHLGDIKEFLANRGAETFREFEQNKQPSSTKKQTNNESSYEQRKEQQREYKKIQRAIQKIEQTILLTEEELTTLDSQLQDPSFYENKADESFFNQYNEKKESISLLYQEYERLLKQQDSFDPIN